MVANFSARNGHKVMVTNFVLYMVTDDTTKLTGIAQIYYLQFRMVNEIYIMNAENMNEKDTIFTNRTYLHKYTQLHL